MLLLNQYSSVLLVLIKFLKKLNLENWLGWQISAKIIFLLLISHVGNIQNFWTNMTETFGSDLGEVGWRWMFCKIEGNTTELFNNRQTMIKKSTAFQNIHVLSISKSRSQVYLNCKNLEEKNKRNEKCIIKSTPFFISIKSIQYKNIH